MLIETHKCIMNGENVQNLTIGVFFIMFIIE